MVGVLVLDRKVTVGDGGVIVTSGVDVSVGIIVGARVGVKLDGVVEATGVAVLSVATVARPTGMPMSKPTIRHTKPTIKVLEGEVDAD